MNKIHALFHNNHANKRYTVGQYAANWKKGRNCSKKAKDNGIKRQRNRLSNPSKEISSRGINNHSINCEGK